MQAGPFLSAAYLTTSAVTFVVYGIDKTAARRGTWRTPENALHTLSLLGGWPGALLAQRVFRHKTRKQPFRTIFWITVVVNAAVVVLILWT